MRMEHEAFVLCSRDNDQREATKLHLIPDAFVEEEIACAGVCKFLAWAANGSMLLTTRETAASATIDLALTSTDAFCQRRG